MTSLAAGQAVFHAQFGAGHVEFSKGETAIVRFKHGLEECIITSLRTKLGLRECIETKQLSPVQRQLPA